MFTFLSPELAYALIFACVMIWFFAGHAMDSIMGTIGFGVFGNMIVMAAGQALGMILVNMAGLPMNSMQVLVASSLLGAFGALLLLAFLKQVFLRI